tara:strand:- start:412 stop:1329 length:918 start_codon:yes stop_codon:yes gene_type:complete
MNLKPINQTKLYGLNDSFNELHNLFLEKKLPNKILFSGKKGIGKSTLAYHLINCILSKDEEFKYNLENFTINNENRSFKLIQNGSNQNFNLLDLVNDKKVIEVYQIRDLINKMNKSSFNNKPRFVLIDNIELLNVNSANALLKTLEEPNQNIFFILINSEKKILSTIKSRCLDFKISLSYENSLSVINNILGKNVIDLVNKELLNYYFSPGNIYNMIKFSENENINLTDKTLNLFLKIIIKENLYKKDGSIKNLVYELIELMLHKIDPSNYHYYDYFLKRIDDIKRFNLDEESFFIEFETKILNA